MADETAGSDLDGDMYVVIGDPEIVSNFSASMPYLATPIPPHTSSEVSGGTALWRGSQAYGEASGGGRGGISGDTVTLLELEPEAASPAASALRSMTTYYLLLTTTTYYLLLTTYYLLVTTYYCFLLLPYYCLTYYCLTGHLCSQEHSLLRLMCFAYSAYYDACALLTIVTVLLMCATLYLMRAAGSLSCTISSWSFDTRLPQVSSK